MLGDIPSPLRPDDATDEDVLYAVDAGLNVAYASPSWYRFAYANNGARLREPGWDRRLLAGFSGSERLRWEPIYAALLDGRLASHEEDFICPSPSERRTFRLRIRRHPDASGSTAYLLHQAVRWDGAHAASVLGERLRAIGAEQDPLVEAFRRIVQERPVRSVRLATAQHFAPLGTVGGDLLWHRDWPGGATDLVIADVMGHGMEAAPLASRLFLLLESKAAEAAGPAMNVARVSQALFDVVRARQPMRGPLFATGLYLRVVPASAQLTVCSFGHAGPIFSASGYLEPPPGLPVGIVDNASAGPWAEMTVRFADHGARFVAFTDGLSEQFNPAGEMFGAAGIERVFRRTLLAPVVRVVDEIRAEAEAFRGAALVKDDQALIAVDASRR